jgi:hypothetical protein
MDDHDPEVQEPYVLLVFQFAVDGYEYIEGILGEAQPGTVLAAAPADLSDCLDSNAWKCRPHSSIDAFV